MVCLHFDTSPPSSAMKPVSASNFMLCHLDKHLPVVCLHFGTSPPSSAMKAVSAASNIVRCHLDIYLWFVYILVPLRPSFAMKDVRASNIVIFHLDRCNIYLFFTFWYLTTIICNKACKC